jgi:hypothetical protein
MEDCCQLMRETDLPHISKFWEMKRYENSYSFYTLIVWMSYLFARKKVTRMNACFQSMTKTVVPFGGSVFVSSSNRVLCGERLTCITIVYCMYEIPLSPVTTVALFRFQASPSGIYGGQNGIGTCLLRVARGGVVVKALRYKPAGRGFDSWWCHWNFSVT